MTIVDYILNLCQGDTVFSLKGRGKCTIFTLSSPFFSPLHFYFFIFTWLLIQFIYCIHGRGGGGGEPQGVPPLYASKLYLWTPTHLAMDPLHTCTHTARTHKHCHVIHYITKSGIGTISYLKREPTYIPTQANPQVKLSSRTHDH